MNNIVWKYLYKWILNFDKEIKEFKNIKEEKQKDLRNELEIHNINDIFISCKKELDEYIEYKKGWKEYILLK